MIPKKINYIFGLRENFCWKPFQYFHYLNILSAKILNPTYEFTLYYYYKPDSEYFEKLSEFCKLIKLDNIPDEISGRKIEHGEHICDLLRIELIYREGGIYLDSDTICIKPFDDLLNNKFVMGLEWSNNEREKDEIIGLCNAVVMGEQHNEFCKIWINEFYNDYQPEWNYNCVKMPYTLSQKYSDLINVQPRNSFFKYSWDKSGFADLYENNSDVSDCYVLHLWESCYYNDLKLYDKDYIVNSNTTVANQYKKYLAVNPPPTIH